VTAGPPFGLEVTHNVDAGYTETLCVMCQNAAGSTTQHDNWKIQQTRNCATALVGMNNPALISEGSCSNSGSITNKETLSGTSWTLATCNA